MTLVVENIMCAKLKRRRLSSPIPLTALSFVGVALALPGSYKKKIRTKEWVENSWPGNSKLSFKHCVSLVPYLCSEGSVTQVSATRGWEVNRMLYSLSMNQLKKISYLVGKTKSSISQCMAWVGGQSNSILGLAVGDAR